MAHHDFRSSSIYLDECEALSMMDRQDIDQIALRLVSLVPPGLAQAQQDLRANFQDVLAQGLRRLDLVTREEFDVQTQVLARTRAKVDELERRVAELEAAVAASRGLATDHSPGSRLRSVTLTPRTIGGGYLFSSCRWSRLMSVHVSDPFTRERLLAA